MPGPRWPRSLQARLLAGVLAVVTVVWGAAALVTWRDVGQELDELLDAHLAQAAALLVVQQAQELEHDDDRLLDAPQLHRYAPRAVFQVFHEGQLVLRSAQAPVAPLVPLAEAARGGFSSVALADGGWRVFAARGAERDVQVLVAERLDARASIVWAALRGTLWPLALALPLLAGLVGIAIHRGLGPLRSLREQLGQRQPQSLQPLAADAAPSEIAPLVAALNALFERIAGLLDSERRFTADAAHELRTPIAAIRTQAQVALGEADDARRRHALLATLQGCDRATRLVEQLLTLARLEAGAALGTQGVDLVALARQVLGDLAPQAAARGQDLGLDIAPGAAPTVPGDATLLAVLLRNLVDNALRHSPDGARIAVQIGTAAAGTTLQVEDSGAGLPEDFIDRLGQRFLRGPQAAAGAGSGLGWSIVRRIAAVQGLALHIGRSAALGGLQVRVAWPGTAPRPAP